MEKRENKGTGEIHEKDKRARRQEGQKRRIGESVAGELPDER